MRTYRTIALDEEGLRNRSPNKPEIGNIPTRITMNRGYNWCDQLHAGLANLTSRSRRTWESYMYIQHILQTPRVIRSSCATRISRVYFAVIPSRGYGGLSLSSTKMSFSPIQNENSPTSLFPGVRTSPWISPLFTSTARICS